MNSQQPSRPVITPAMREQAVQQPNTWLYVVDPIFTDTTAEVPPWGFIGGYRVDEHGGLTDDFSPNPNYRPSPVALRLPAPTNDAERALQLTTTGYAQGQALLSALLEAELILFAQPQGSGLFTLEHESGRRQLQVFTSDGYLPANWTTWQRMTGRQLAGQQLAGMDLQVNPTSPVKARVPGEDLTRASAAIPRPSDVPGTPAGGPAPPGKPTPAGTPETPCQKDIQQAATWQADTDPADSDFGRRFLGALLGGAVGDALGATVEFYPVDQIRSRYGREGVTDYDREDEQPGEFTDDTQMTLFTLEGLIRGHIAVRTGAAGTPLPAVQLAYQRWLHTQGYSWQRAAGPFLTTHPEPDGWLSEQSGLFNVRSPGSSGITALREFASGAEPGTFEHALNDSQGCGGVARAAPVALWSDDTTEIFELASATAALTYSHPGGYLPAGALAVLVHRLVRGEPLTEAIHRARSVLTSYDGHAETDRALQAAVDLAEQGKPSPERLKDALGGGWSGHEALAIAVCAALSTGDAASAVMVAVNHSGDSDSTGAVCGNLVGAMYGASALPGGWVRDLRQRETVEALCRDALTEFGPQPPDDDRWARRYPARHDTSELPFTATLQPATAPQQPDEPDADTVRPAPAVTDTPPDEAAAGTALVRVGERSPQDRTARILGCLLGGAVGDAFGYAVEFDSLETIRGKYGASGLTDFVDAHRPGGSISDDTQMTLFTLEGLIRAGVRRRLHGETEPATQVQHAYQRWLHTQGFDWKDAGGPIADTPPDGWLIRERGLFVRRAPGTTCIQALHGYAGGTKAGSFGHRLNDSKGCGGVMRAAPASLWSDDTSEVFRVGALTGALTHGHPSGFLPAGALAVIVQLLLEGRGLQEAVDRALEELSAWDDNHETSACLRRARELAAEWPPSAELIQQQFGGGWVGEEALAIAVYAALACPESFSEAIVVAANHSGDSDSTAAICGNIMGAACTAAAIPQRWREKLELREVIEQLTLDAVQEFGPNPSTDPEWLERYPVDDSAGTGATEGYGPPSSDTGTAPAVTEEPAAPNGGTEAGPGGPGPHSTELADVLPAIEFLPTAATARPEQDPGEADGHLSDEELRLLAVWRKFRDNDDGTPADLSENLHSLLIEAFGPERAAQLVGEAPDDGKGHGRLAVETPVELDRGERLAGCLLGGAAGDALGAPWMLADLDGIHRVNPDGIRELAEAFGRHGAATSITQQAVFLFDGLVRADIRSRLRGIGAHRAGMVRFSLEHWLCTQGAPFEPSMPGGTLNESAILCTQRFPDEPSLMALSRWSGRHDLPTPAHPPNAARGAGATARGAVVGLSAQCPATAMSLGVEIAVITHGSPDGYLPAGALAGLVGALAEGRTLAASVRTVLSEMDRFEGGENTVRALRGALELAEHGPASPASLEGFGPGWDAPSALAIAVAAALSRPDSYREAVSLAATHSGNSAATAAICGSLLGTARGTEAIPAEWVQDLELQKVLDELLADHDRIDTDIAVDGPVPDWAERYLS